MKKIKKRPTCALCDTRPSYGLVWQKPTHCATHKTPDMTDVVNKRCALCDTLATYGLVWQKPTHCATHKTPDMSDVMHKRCSTGDGYGVWKNLPKGYPDLCLGCFDKTYPDHPKIKRRKTKETFFFHKFRQALPDIPIRWDKAVPNGCGILRRPDYFIEGVYRDLVGECDENDHASYDTTCEEARLHDLAVANGYRPIHMFRFNPDGKPSAVRIARDTGIASEGPGYKALMSEITTSIRAWLAWDAATPLSPDESLLNITYL